MHNSVNIRFTYSITVLTLTPAFSAQFVFLVHICPANEVVQHPAMSRDFQARDYGLTKPEM